MKTETQGACYNDTWYPGKPDSFQSNDLESKRQPQDQSIIYQYVLPHNGAAFGHFHLLRFITQGTHIRKDFQLHWRARPRLNTELMEPCLGKD